MVDVTAVVVNESFKRLVHDSRIMMERNEVESELLRSIEEFYGPERAKRLIAYKIAMTRIQYSVALN